MYAYTLWVLTRIASWGAGYILFATLPLVLEDQPIVRFLTAVVQAWLGSYVGKPSSAYGWSGGFSPGSPVFAHLR